jgi:succinoglycan biosynthesis protein ExoA
VSDWRNDPAWPDVDVVMPIRNEAEHLAAAVASVRAQDYPGSLRIVLGVGPSTDGTEALAELMAASSVDLEVVPNPSGKTPSALNVAISAGASPVVVRVDGHSELAPGYIEHAVVTLRSSGAVNVGGIQRPEATTAFEQAVADATTSLLGTGGASYRVGTTARAVDTVYLGVFDRAAIEAVGLFDESLIRNQDYELNIRLRAAGGTVWFDPSLAVTYTPRGSWKALAKQYHEYGWWKAAVLRKHPHSLRLRQLIPLVGVSCVTAGLLVGLRRGRALVVPGVYLAALVGTVHRADHPVRTMLAIVTTHAAWATGLLRGLIRSPLRDERPRRR